MIRAAAVLCLLATPGLGQSAGEMTAKECLKSFAYLADLIETDASARLGDENWCMIESSRFDLGNQTNMQADQIRWRLDGVDRLADGLPPIALSVEVENLRIVRETGNAVVDYLLGVQQAAQPINGSLDIGWDRLKSEVRLRKAELDFGQLGRVDMTAQISRVDLSDMPAVQASVNNAGLTELDMRIVSTGLFERYVAFPLGTTLLGGSNTPSADISRYKAQAIAAVQAAPDDLLDANSVEALSTLIADLPNPFGEVDISLQSENGITRAHFLPLSLIRDQSTPIDSLREFLPDFTLSLRYVSFGRN